MLELILLAQVLITLLYLGKIGLWLILGVFLTLVGLYLWTVKNFLKKKHRKISYEDLPWLYKGIMKMANKAGIKTPEVYLLDDYIPNAYSFRNSIVLSLGLFEVLDEEEILAVAAHEIGHIKNRDTLLFPLVSCGRYFMLVMAFLNLLFLFSRSTFGSLASFTLYLLYEVCRSHWLKQREFKADETALHLIPVPLALKRALEELKYYEDLRVRVKESALPSIEPTIERPHQKSLFETHPTYEERIWRIMAEIEAMNPRERMFS
ncbi:M48 family metalloprotease [Thermococcus aggregans]|uniref:M48 family metalloprotease n=1 Tax=Thermococcus aggregans TaxID=110163 RepID=A0A9E7MZ86_THEAG|nr:M48 family metalloprotease [Thermococcus aggregans]USS41593.1 M48 family metalloprotease [Thermococcus aggregans]